MLHTTRRALLAGAAVAGPLAFSRRTRAAAREIKIALLTPLSGPWARQGELEKKGALMAIEDANKAGGVRSLGGAPLRLVLADAGGSVEQTTAAAQRLVAQQPDLVAGIGVWLSSFTLAATAVTERAQLPWCTLSWADTLTNRGFRYIIATSPASSQIIGQSLPPLVALASKTAGKPPATIALMDDDTAASQANVKPLREGGLAKLHLKAVIDETFSPPLSDATPLIQRIRRERPDFVLLGTTNVPDSRLLLEKLTEFGLGHGRVPVFAPSAAWGTPEMLKIVGAENLEGLIGVAGNWGSNRQKPLLDEMCRRSGETWMTQDTLSTYGHVMLIKDALERAADTDRQKIMAALLATDTTEGPAHYFLGTRLRFERDGRRADPVAGVFQWKNGVPLTVLPEEDAFAPLTWPQRQT